MFHDVFINILSATAKCLPRISITSYITSVGNLRNDYDGLINL